MYPRNENILLSKAHFRDDNEMICEVTGHFKVGQANVRIMSLTSNWESNQTKNIYVSFNSREDTSVCEINTQVFTGEGSYKVFVNRFVVQLPVKEER